MKILKRHKIPQVTCENCGCIFQPKYRDLIRSTRYVKELVECPFCKKENYIKFKEKEND